MTDHILDISESGAFLRVHHGCLQVEQEGKPTASLPLKEIATLLLVHPQITCTRSVLSGLAAAGAPVITCDDGHMPVAMSLPLVGHHVASERFIAQAAASKPVRKRLWQQVVKAKVRSQGRLLANLRGDNMGLAELARTVRSGDPANVEAQASRIYWPLLFDDINFLRRRQLPDQNRLLNYGYAVLRALVARAICSSGLHPCLGIHHHNRYNSFCLADDLMEPFRVIVDMAVVEIVAEHGTDTPLGPAIKSHLIGALMRRYMLDKESRTLFDILGRLAASLAAVFTGQARSLVCPEI